MSNTKYEKRLSRPESGNPYYNRRSSGGYSTCIAGNPTQQGLDTLSNCVGYAVGRFHEIANRPQFDLLPSTNAENLIAAAESAGLACGKIPKLGALMAWAKGKAGNAADGAGHCAIVEDIQDGNTVITSESGWGSSKVFWCGRYPAPYAYRDGYTFLGFVYQPENQCKWISRGDKGETVRIMQRRLIAAGYLRKGEDDGDFGNITFGALLAYQMDNGIAVDGVCGPASCRKLGV